MWAPAKGPLVHLTRSSAHLFYISKDQKLAGGSLSTQWVETFDHLPPFCFNACKNIHPNIDAAFCSDFEYRNKSRIRRQWRGSSTLNASWYLINSRARVDQRLESDHSEMGLFWLSPPFASFIQLNISATNCHQSKASNKPPITVHTNNTVSQLSKNITIHNSITRINHCTSNQHWKG